MKIFSLRLPDDLHEWLVIESARETVRLKKQVSINSLICEILQQEMREQLKTAEPKDGGK